MTTWNDDELRRIADADELQVAPRRGDGTLRSPTTIWVVRDGDDLYIRSYRGGDGAWYRAARAAHQGRINAGGIDKDVTFVEETDPGTNDRIDNAYRTKYAAHGAVYVDPMVSPRARAATLRLVP